MQIVSKVIIFEKNKSFTMTEIKTAPPEKLETVTGENVSQENTGQVLEIMTADQVADNEVKKFNLALAWIEQRKKEYSGLAIAGVDDKEGFKAVDNAWREIRQKRLAVANKHKELKADYLVITRKIDGAKNQFTDLLEEIEIPLKAELDRIEKIKDDEKNRVARELEERLQARVTELLASGMRFDGSFYSIGTEVSMDVVTLKEMNEENYSRLLGIVKDKHQAELDRIAKEKEEKEKEAAALALQKQQQEEAEQKLANEREAIKKERRDGRTEILVSKGLVFNKLLTCWEYTYKDEKEQFRTADLGELDSNSWSSLFAQVVMKIDSVQIRATEKEAAKLQAEKEAEEKQKALLEQQKKDAEAEYTFDLRVQKLLNIGFVFGIDSYYVLAGANTSEKIDFSIEAIKSFSEELFSSEMERARSLKNQIIIDDAFAKEAAEKKAEELRVAQLSEVEQMTEFLEKMKVVYNGFIPTVSNIALVSILNKFKDSFEHADEILKSI